MLGGNLGSAYCPHWTVEGTGLAVQSVVRVLPWAWNGAGTARRPGLDIFAIPHSRLNFMQLGTQRTACDVAHVERLGADLRRGGRRHGQGVPGAAGLIVDRERRKLRRNYAKLSQPKPVQAGAAPALQLLDLL